MIDRMRKDLISSQLRSQALKISVDSKSEIVNDETEKQRRAKQERIQAKIKIQTIMNEIDADQKDRAERIGSLQKSIKNKEEALKRRMERVRRQQEIADMAANENKDQNEVKMYQEFLIHRLYSSFLKRKMEKEMNRHVTVEEAFQNIRTATGFSDVNEIVHRFLTREQTYSTLLMAVSENERKIDNLRVEHEKNGSKLHDLQMGDEDEEDNGGKKKSHGITSTPEIDELDGKIMVLTKDKELTDELCKKVNLVNDQVNGWISRVIHKIDHQFRENISAHEHNKSLSFLFE